MNTQSVSERAVTVGGYTFNRAAYTQTDTGRILGGVTRQHIANMIEAGELRAIRLGRRVLIPASEIARLLSEASTEGRPMSAPRNVETAPPPPGKTPPEMTPAELVGHEPNAWGVTTSTEDIGPVK